MAINFQVNYGYSSRLALPITFVNRPSAVTSSPARRRLFADSVNGADQEDALKVLERQYALIQREQTLKYNFDFEAEKPLSGGGRYLWERPSHPLPPAVPFKRSLEPQEEEEDSTAPQAKFQRLNSTSTLQTKITGKFSESLF